MRKVVLVPLPVRRQSADDLATTLAERDGNAGLLYEATDDRSIRRQAQQPADAVIGFFTDFKHAGAIVTIAGGKALPLPHRPGRKIHLQTITDVGRFDGPLELQALETRGNTAFFRKVYLLHQPVELLWIHRASLFADRLDLRSQRVQLRLEHFDLLEQFGIGLGLRSRPRQSGGQSGDENLFFEVHDCSWKNRTKGTGISWYFEKRRPLRGRAAFRLGRSTNWPRRPRR